MAEGDFIHRRLRAILKAEYDFESPIDEDLLDNVMRNVFTLANMISSLADIKFKAQAAGAPVAGLLTMDTITSGLFERDDQYNETQILVTSGTASGKGVNSRFPVTDSDESAQTFTCGDNSLGETLQAAGMGDNDTFEIIGHTHDGIDSPAIDATDIDFTNQGLGINAYTASGRSQSLNFTTATATHTITGLPSGDNIIFGWYKIEIEQFNTGVDFEIECSITINGKTSLLRRTDGNYENGDNWVDSGGISAEVQNGDTVSITVNNDNSRLRCKAEFILWAFEPVG